MMPSGNNEPDSELFLGYDDRDLTEVEKRELREYGLCFQKKRTIPLIISGLTSIGIAATFPFKKKSYIQLKRFGCGFYLFLLGHVFIDLYASASCSHHLKTIRNRFQRQVVYPVGDSDVHPKSSTSPVEPNDSDYSDDFISTFDKEDEENLKPKEPKYVTYEELRQRHREEKLGNLKSQKWTSPRQGEFSSLETDGNALEDREFLKTETDMWNSDNMPKMKNKYGDDWE